MSGAAAGFGLTIVPDARAMGGAAADAVAAAIHHAPEAAIAVPTGSTPLPMFEELVGRVRRGELDLSRAHLYCLDEYLGVTADDPNSLTGWLRRAFLEPAGVDPTRIHVVPAADADPAAAAARYEAELAERGGLALAVLGLGPNGHVAYNEPGTDAESRTRIVSLTPESIAQASAYWEGELPIPERAITVGVGTLREARRIVLIVSGAAKADILRRALQEPMSDAVPASWLRLEGERLTVIADEAAASRLD